MYGRPAGLSDFESSDSGNDEEFFFARPMRPKTNGQPLTADEIILRRDLELAKKLLDRTTSTEREGFLVKCCGVGWLDGVAHLLSMDMSPNEPTQPQTPLVATLDGWGDLNDREKCVEFLLEQGADVNISTKDHRYPLIAAVENGTIGLVQLLLNQPGINLESKNLYGETALLAAARQDKLDIVQLLIDAGSDINAKRHDGMTYQDLIPEKIVQENTTTITVGQIFDELDYTSNNETLSDDRSCLKFVEELPDKKGHGGFPSDALNILRSAQSDHFPLNLSLPEILTVTEEKLIDSGVNISVFRMNILQEIHRFHLKAWHPNSLPKPSFHLEELLETSATMLKHLVILNSSFNYVDMNLKKFDGAPTHEILNALCESKCDATRIRLRLQLLNEGIVRKYSGSSRSPDWVFPKQIIKPSFFSPLLWSLLLCVGVKYLFHFSQSLLK